MFVDPLGLLEEFHITFRGGNTAWLTHRRVNSDGSIMRTSYPVFSGQGEHRNNPESMNIPNIGSLPTGTWYIVDRPIGGWLGPVRARYGRQRTWFALYRDDETIDDLTMVDGVIRENFRMHAGTRSDGCLTFVNADQYSRVRELLLNTETALIPGTTIRHYGKISVSKENTVINCE
jgi:hypothetical protein